MSAQQAVPDVAPALTDEDLRGLLGVGRTTFYKWKALGRFRDLLVSPQRTPTARYSPALVSRWLDGERSLRLQPRKRA